MNTVAVSPAHLALVAQRRADLRAALERALPPRSKFLLEVGSGHGHFLAAYAMAHPDEPCVGVDIAAERVARANRKRDRAGLSNLHFFHADIHDFFAALPPGARFSAIVILFSDPWPKRRHHKNRLIQPAFLDALAARTEQGTRLYFRTDHGAYFAHAADVLMDHHAWKISNDAPWTFEFDTVFQSRASAHHSLVAERFHKKINGS